MSYLFYSSPDKTYWCPTHTSLLNFRGVGINSSLTRWHGTILKINTFPQTLIHFFVSHQKLQSLASIVFGMNATRVLLRSMEAEEPISVRHSFLYCLFKHLIYLNPSFCCWDVGETVKKSLKLVLSNNIGQPILWWLGVKNSKNSFEVKVIVNYWHCDSKPLHTRNCVLCFNGCIYLDHLISESDNIGTLDIGNKLKSDIPT